MKFQTRLVLATSLTTLVTFGAAFAAVQQVFGRSEERELDESVREAVRDELHELAQKKGASVHLSAIDGPPGDDAAPLERLAALYEDDRLLESTEPACAPKTPPANELGVTFRLTCRATRMQAMVVPVPGRRPNLRLLIALPRTNLESDERFLTQTLGIALVLAIGAATGVTFVVVRRLTLQHDAIAETARRVAGGDLAARAPQLSRDAELVQLTTDINTMIDRLGTLVESQKRFIAHAAHELRSPLTALLGELSLATRRERTPEEYKKAIAEALSATRRLKLLTEDLLALARLGTDAAAAPETTSLRAVVAEALATVRASAAEHGVDVDAETDDAELLARPRDLVRLVRNLVDNAIVHVGRGGRVRVVGRRTDDGVELVVEDDGPGVPPSERAKIFEPFYRSAEDRAREEPGAGLGLSIVREIAGAHRGDVRVEGAEPKGARFVVSLRGCSPSKRGSDRTADDPHAA